MIHWRDFMKFLAKEIPLSSDKYTNHSIRHSVINTLEESGYEAHHIMAITGHKSESTIKKYVKRCLQKNLREMSDTLAQPLCKKSKLEVATAENTSEENQTKVPLTDITDTDIQIVPFDTDDDLLLKFLTDTSDTNTNTKSTKLCCPND